MKLKTVKIENFRSIKNLKLDVETIAKRTCFFMLGINESGKSNILKALSLLDKNAKCVYAKDCERYARRTSKDIVIEFLFNLNKDDMKIISEVLEKNEILNNKYAKSLQLIRQIKFTNNGQRIDSYIPVDPIISPGLLITTPNELDERNALYQKYGELLSKKIDELSPRIIYWKFSPEYLITQPIDLNVFKNNLQVSIPLRNIFYLTGLKQTDIASVIERSHQELDERSQLEHDLSTKTTEHLNKIWPEHKIEIHVRIENSTCSVHVKDKDDDTRTFNMEDRSDGFKQFVSILLVLSVETRVDALKNAIILIDEPENNLHPSSVMYLRDELLKISENNFVLVASHSIFIVDKKNLERHIKVFKEKGETKIEHLSSDNPFNEEVIYRALGTSIYEIIEPYILIFEGIHDKDVYDAFSNKFKEEIEIEHVKTIAASGVNEIRKYTKFFNQQTVTGIVVVDSDKEGRDELSVIRQSTSAFENTIFEINSILNETVGDKTLEDLFPYEVMRNAFRELYNIELSIPEAHPILRTIKHFKRDNNINLDNDLSELKCQLKKQVVADMSLSIEELREKYSIYLNFLTGLNGKISGIQSLPR